MDGPGFGATKVPGAVHHLHTVLISIMEVFRGRDDRSWIRTAIRHDSTDVTVTTQWVSGT